MYGRFCKNSLTSVSDCAKNVDVTTLTQTGFEQAKAMGKGLGLTIDHDEATCHSKYNGECYYTIVVVGLGRNSGDVARYSIASGHSQQNFVILSESKAVNDYVEYGTYRYFSFTLPPTPQTSAKTTLRPINVTITLNSLHGDADLFVSRITQHPNQIDFEKNSVKSGDSYDMVFFDDKTGNTDLSGTYYISVYSLQYSAYTIVVNVDRSLPSGNKNSLISKDTKIVTTLIEGLPQRGQISSSLGENIYSFSVKQLEGFEKPIKIQLSPLSGRFKLFAKFGIAPT